VLSARRMLGTDQREDQVAVDVPALRVLHGQAHSLGIADGMQEEQWIYGRDNAMTIGEYKSKFVELVRELEREHGRVKYVSIDKAERKYLEKYSDEVKYECTIEF